MENNALSLEDDDQRARNNATLMVSWQTPLTISRVLCMCYPLLIFLIGYEPGIALFITTVTGFSLSRSIIRKFYKQSRHDIKVSRKYCRICENRDD